MKFEIDCHCHTVASGHAYSTIKEYAEEAAENGLKLIAITDHGPDMPGSCNMFYFQNLKVIPERLFGVRILKGAEVNIIDYNGKVDIPDEVLKELDFVIASFHHPCIKVQDRELNTKAFIETMKNPYIHVIGHPDDGRIPIDYYEIVKAAKEYGKMLEVNNSSLSPNSFRDNAAQNYKEMLKECKKAGVPVIVNSDSHFHTYVGKFDLAVKVLKDAEFPEELIANISLDRFYNIIGKK